MGAGGRLLLVALLAWAFDCRVDEGSVHACSAAGIDIGPVLYGLGMSGWLILGLWPVMILTVLLWRALLVWVIVRRFMPRVRVIARSDSSVSANVFAQIQRAGGRVRKNLPAMSRRCSGRLRIARRASRSRMRFTGTAWWTRRRLTRNSDGRLEAE